MMHFRGHNALPRSFVVGLAHLRSLKFVQVASLTSLALVGSAAGCKSRTPKAVHVPQMAQGFDNGAIDAGHLDSDAAARHHVLNMSVLELTARVPSYVLRTQSTITLRNANQQVSQQAQSTMLAQDALGHMHLQTGNAQHQLEVFAMTDKAYVRQDRGHLRAKRRQEMEVAEMAEAAASNLRQLLQHFVGVALTHPTAGTQDGRAIVRYDVDLTGTPFADAVPQPALGRLPILAPSMWREEAKNQRLEGKVVVDQQTGVVLRAEVSGSMLLVGHEGPSLTLTLRTTHTLSEINKLSPIKEPTGSVTEFRRPLRMHDPLSFYRDAQLPGTPAGNNKTPKAAAVAPVSQDDPSQGPPSEDQPLDDTP